MNPWPAQAESAVAAFAQSLGLPARQAPDDSYSFALSKSGSLSFTFSIETREMIVSLARPEEGVEADVLSSAFGKAGFDEASGRFLHVGMSEDGEIVRAFSFLETEIDPYAINVAVDRLIELQAD